MVARKTTKPKSKSRSTSPPKPKSLPKPKSKSGFTMPKRATGDGAVGLKRIGVAADPDSPAGRVRAGTPLDPEHPYFVLECTTHGKEQRVICSDFNLIRMFAMIAMELGVKLPRSVAERIVMLDGAGPMTFSYAEPETLGDRVAMNLMRASMEAEMSKRAAAAGLVMARVEPTGEPEEPEKPEPK